MNMRVWNSMTMDEKEQLWNILIDNYNMNK